MKICFIVGAFPNMKCGIGDYTSKLANELSNLNNDVNVITSEGASINSDSNIKVFNIVKKWNFRNLKKILKQIKEIQPDIVNIQYPSKEYKKNIMINFLPFLIKKHIKCKIVVTVHEYTIFTILGKIRNWISFIKADEIIVVEKAYISEIRKVNKNAKISYVPIASSIKQSKLGTDEIFKIRKDLKTENNKLISYFGFANQSKGIEELFKAIKEIPKIKLLFIGDLNEKDEYQKTLIQLAEQIEITDRIIITGYQEEEKVANYLKCSDACILPFKFGVSKRNSSFLAAYNQNIPVVTTTKEKTYQSDDNVYYVQIGNVEELIKNIMIAINNKENINRQIITWDVIAKRYVEIMEDVDDNRD